MALTPGEQMRIYEEEMIRLQAQQDMARRRVASAYSAGCLMAFTLGTLGLAVVALLLYVGNRAIAGGAAESRITLEEARDAAYANPYLHYLQLQTVGAARRLAEELQVVLEKDEGRRAPEKSGTVHGRIRNASRRTVRYWRVTARVRDENDRPSAVASASSQEPIRPGESVPYQIKLDRPVLAGAAKERVRVQIDEIRFENDQ